MHMLRGFRDTSGDDGDTQSLAHNIMDYPFEQGRRYHKYREGLYPYPNYGQELDHLDMQHHLCTTANEGRLFFSPLTDPKNTLDVGTGTGHRLINYPFNQMMFRKTFISSSTMPPKKTGCRPSPPGEHGGIVLPPKIYHADGIHPHQTRRNGMKLTQE
ncbi:hypothetical protein Egran_00761 [Elaphomyces granulatus]|uniref:Uncharacterized protein n=1 Tax=Elaphomyces granulatus TaxID=519963 RepID=A0A232M4Y6_9EURO|nr:hypothetical protein Egran_00761 [Elaphomyces granulatus]